MNIRTVGDKAINFDQIRYIDLNPQQLPEGMMPPAVLIMWSNEEFTWLTGDEANEMNQVIGQLTQNGHKSNSYKAQNTISNTISKPQLSQLNKLYTERHPKENSMEGLNQLTQKLYQKPLMKISRKEAQALIARLTEKSTMNTKSAPIIASPTMTTAQAQKHAQQLIAQIQRNLQPSDLPQVSHATRTRLIELLGHHGFGEEQAYLRSICEALLGRAITTERPLGEREGSALVIFLELEEAAIIIDILWPRT